MKLHGIVAIIGRPNVGKSTLFNRLTRSDAAIVDDRPGVTRDRIYGHVRVHEDADGSMEGFALIDTGGFEKDGVYYQPFAENLVWKQTAAAIDEADVVLLLVDGKAGLHPHDRELHRYLEKQGKPCIVAANKVDGPEQRADALEFYELGVEDVPMCSAAHNRGISELAETIEKRLLELPSTTASESIDPNAIRIAIIGRPNAGKSSIINRLTGLERAVVSDVAGTTRDSLDTPLIYNKQTFTLVDTAGIRRRSKVLDKVEGLSVARALRAIERADVVFLVLDAEAGLTDQDMRLANLAADRHKPLAIIFNKWDLVPNKHANSGKDYADAVHRLLKTLAFTPVAFVSCLTNQRVHALLSLAQRLATMAGRRVETSKVNAALRQMVQEHTPALFKGKTRRVKFYFATQVATHAPTFVVFCNVYNEIQESYIRYMTRRFQTVLGFNDVPIRLIFRPKSVVRARDAREGAQFERETHGSKLPAGGRSHIDHFADDAMGDEPAYDDLVAADALDDDEFEVTARDLEEIDDVDSDDAVHPVKPGIVTLT